MQLNTNWKTVNSLISIAIVILVLMLIAFRAALVSIYIPSFHLDGAFQTASGLFRLDSGQLFGRDFFSYLGMGPILVIYPIFKISGSDLAASVFAANFMTIFLSWIAVSVLWHLIYRATNVMQSVVVGSVIFFGGDFLRLPVSVQSILGFGFSPGNSLRPIRAVVPYLVAMSAYYLIKNFSIGNRRDFLIGLVLGSALIWSNDYAITTFGVFLAFHWCYFYYFEKATWKQSLVIVTAFAFLTGLCLLFVTTAGHPLALLRYNFQDVFRDQFWYFGPYGAEARVFELTQLSRLFTVENYFPLLVLLVVVMVAIKKRAIEDLFVICIGLTLFAGGSLASIGGHFDGYFASFSFFGFIASIILSFRVLREAAPRVRDWLAFNQFLLCSVLLLFAFLVRLSWLDYKKSYNLAKDDPGRFYVSELGGFLTTNYKPYIEYARQHREAIAIEDYWGLWGALNKKFPPWPVDSVIHALGRVRESSKLSHNNVKLVITTRYYMSPIWQLWVISQNFWFYDELFWAWEPVFRSPTTVVWKRADKPRRREVVECNISSGKKGISLLPAMPGFYRVSMNYSSYGGKYLLMFKNNISYAVGANGFISLQPGSRDAVFPAYILPKGSNEFYFNLIGKADVEISSCTAERIAYQNTDLLHETKSR